MKSGLEPQDQRSEKDMVANKKSLPGYVWITVALAAVLRGVYAYFSFYDPEEYSYIIAVKTNDFHRFIGMIQEFRAGCLDLFFLKFIYTISHNELFIRWSFILPGLIFIILIYYIIHKMSGSSFVAGAVTLMVAFSPLHIYYAQVIRYHVFVCIFSALSIYSFYALLTEKPSWKRYGLYGLSTALAMMSHYYVAYLVAAQGAAFFVMYGRSLAKWKVYILSQAAAFVFFIPWAPMFMYHMNSRSVGSGCGLSSIIDQFRGTGVLNMVDAVMGFFLSDSWDFHADALFYKLILISTLVVFLVVAAAAARRFVKEKDDLIKYAAVIFVVTTILPFATLQLTCAVFTPKYLLPFTIMFYVIVAYGLEKMTGTVRLIAVAGLIFICAGTNYVIIDAAGEQPNIKSIIPEIAAQIDDDTALVTNIYVCGENIRDYAGAAGDGLDVVVASRIPRGRAGYMLNAPVDVNDVIRTIKDVEHYENLWLFYCMLGYERNIGDVPTSPEDPYGKIFSAISSQMNLEETIQFKVSPRKLYFVSRAYRFKRK